MKKVNEETTASIRKNVCIHPTCGVPLFAYSLESSDAIKMPITNEKIPARRRYMLNFSFSSSSFEREIAYKSIVNKNVGKC